MASGMIIRPRRAADAARIAEILADGWRDTYGGFMPADYLARQSDRTKRYGEIVEWLANEFDPANEAIFMADADGEATGFIHMALGDKGQLGATGIVNLIYVDRGAQGRGAGRALMASGAQWLLETRPGPLALSAFEANPSRGFYDALGGRAAKRVTHTIAGSELASVLYLWPDPAVLVGARQHHRPR
jgi:GNAT superfamily N-acetyltransferase